MKKYFSLLPVLLVAHFIQSSEPTETNKPSFENPALSSELIIVNGIPRIIFPQNEDEHKTLQYLKTLNAATQQSREEVNLKNSTDKK